jgi:hypothetical protein
LSCIVKLQSENHNKVRRFSIRVVRIKCTTKLGAWGRKGETIMIVSTSRSIRLRQATGRQVTPESFRGDVRALGGDGSFHEKDQADQGERNNAKDKEGIEVGERRRLFGS